MKASRIRIGNIKVFEKIHQLREVPVRITPESVSVFSRYGVLSIEYRNDSAISKNTRPNLMKENALLVQVRENYYVDLDEVNYFWDLYRLKKIDPQLQPSAVGTILLTPIIPISQKLGLRYIDVATFKEVPELEGKNHVSFAYVKKLAENYKAKV